MITVAYDEEVALTYSCGQKKWGKRQNFIQSLIDSRKQTFWEQVGWSKIPRFLSNILSTRKGQNPQFFFFF
jgi:hypothetical protein